MHPDYLSVRYTQPSLLASNMSSRQPLSPPPSRHRPAVSKPTTRNFHTDMPSHSIELGRSSSTSTPTSRPQSPALTLGRRTQSTMIESQQRIMSRGQRDFVKQLQLSSTLAASTYASKPDAPRLDPLGSPGPVTPLALESNNENDYFAVQGVGKVSPAASPGGRTLTKETATKDQKVMD